ncbi:C40 family peptidase [Chitinophaga cymbidii]|nr:hypothetical protein [Chitinophaga cymbidii]
MLFTMIFSACSKDKDKPSGGNHKVVFKAVGSAGTSISTVVYVDGGGENVTKTDLSGSTWESGELTFSSSVQAISFGVQATGPNASATMKVQIFVDGVMKKESSGTGTILVPSATYYF